jgi:hypothetical protein
MRVKTSTFAAFIGLFSIIYCSCLGSFDRTIIPAEITDVYEVSEYESSTSLKKFKTSVEDHSSDFVGGVLRLSICSGIISSKHFEFSNKHSFDSFRSISGRGPPTNLV